MSRFQTTKNVSRSCQILFVRELHYGISSDNRSGPSDLQGLKGHIHVEICQGGQGDCHGANAHIYKENLTFIRNQAQPNPAQLTDRQTPGKKEVQPISTIIPYIHIYTNIYIYGALPEYFLLNNQFSEWSQTGVS